MINTLDRVAGAYTTNLLTKFCLVAECRSDHICHADSGGDLDLCFSSRDCSTDSLLNFVKAWDQEQVEVLACQRHFQAVMT